MGVPIGMTADPTRQEALRPYLVDQNVSPTDEPTLHDRLVVDELRKLRARDAARQVFDLERRGPQPAFDLGTLADVLRRPATPPNRVEHLVPWEAGTLLTAQRKTGKTTTVLNLARCLLTGEDFLGRFGVRQVDGMVALLNFEVSGAQLARWAADVAVPADRLLLVNLRGRRNPLGSVEDREALAAALRARGVETIVCDPFGRAYTGSNQNDAGEVGAFLGQLDRFTRTDVGARDLVLTAHAGWNGERTRGSTALEDWADSIVTLTRDDTEDGTGDRYLRAIGRDVDLDEDRLVIDTETRVLRLAGSGSRKAARAGKRSSALDDTVLAVVRSAPGLSTSEISRRVRDQGVGHQRGDVGQACRRLEVAGHVRSEPGLRGARCYFETTYPDLSPPIPSGQALTYPDPSYTGGVGQEDTSDHHLSHDREGR